MAEQKRIVGKRILLVDDDRGARESIKLLLTIDRHDVVEASGGAEAIELLKGQTLIWRFWTTSCPICREARSLSV